MPYGLLTTGFVPQPLSVIREEMNTEIKGDFGASLDLTDASLLGFIVGIIAERLAILWELAEAINSSQDPDKATGAALDGLCALTGTIREPASESSVTLTLTGTPTTVVGAGSRASIEETGSIWETQAPGTITALSAWSATAYAVDDRVTNATRCYICITAGTSAATGPTTTSADYTDGGGVHWRYMGEGTGAIDVEALCTETGPTVGASGDIINIDTAVGGWSSVINLLDADLGSDEGTDEATRVQREIDLASAGTSPADALREAMLDVEDVTSVTVFMNNTDTTDADGVPPHSVEVLVQGGEDQDIWDALLANVAAGIGTYGDEDGTAEDSQGTEHDMSFTRPDEIEIWVIVNVTYDADEFPDDGDEQIEEAIIDFGDRQKTGKNAVASSLVAQAFTVDGVLDASVLIGLSNPPVASTTLAISTRELAVYDSSRITVNLTPGTP